MGSGANRSLTNAPATRPEPPGRTACIRRRTGWRRAATDTDTVGAMPRIVPPEMVEAAVGALLGAIDIDGGGTDEQLDVLRAVVTHLWERADLDLDAVTPLDPDAA